MNTDLFELYLRKAEAIDYCAVITDVRKRVFVTGALNMALSYLGGSREYLADAQKGDLFDLLTFVKAVDYFCAHEEIFRRSLSGEHSSFEEVIFGVDP